MMEQSELNAIMYTGAKAPNFKLNNGEELDYQLAIAMVNKNKSKI